MNLVELLEDIADAIRAKKGTTAQIPALNFASEINALEIAADEDDYIHYDYFDLLLNGKYGYFSPEMCNKLMTGNYVLEGGI